MAITLDVTWPADAAGSGASHQIPSFHTPTAGCNLIACVIATGGGSVSSVVDTSGNTYTVLPFLTTPGAEKLFLAYSVPTTLGSIKFTANFSPNTRSTIMGASFLGTAASSPLDQSTFPGSGTGTAIASGASGTTRFPNELLIGFACNDSGAAGNTWTPGGSPGGSFTSIANTVTGAVAPPAIMMYQVVSATGNYSTNATNAVSAGWAAGIATFADTPVPPPTVDAGAVWIGQSGPSLNAPFNVNQFAPFGFSTQPGLPFPPSGGGSGKYRRRFHRYT